MAGVRQVSGVLFSMVVRWHVAGVLFSMVMRWQVSGVLFYYGGEVAGVRHVS